MKIVAFVTVLTALVVVLGTALYRVGGADGGQPAAIVESDEPADAQLSQRLAIAYGALRSAEGTRRLPEVHRYASVAIDAIAGPEGRHGREIAPPGGVLPEDAAQIRSEPGLALRAYDAAPEQSPLRAAIDGTVIGSVSGWRTPSDRYDAIDRAVAEYRPDNDTVSGLPGESERALAWALLVLKTDNVTDAHAIAGRAAESAGRALDAVRTARAAAGD